MPFSKLGAPVAGGASAPNPIRHLVRPGECVARIAWHHGIGDPRVVYDAAENADLRGKRPDPNVLRPGDVVVVPDPALRSEPASTFALHNFVAKRPVRELRIRVRGPDDSPLRNEPYVLALPGGSAKEGTTDGDGMLVRRVPIDAASAELTIRDQRFSLRFGHLDPVPDRMADDPGAVADRLRNLGYATGHLPMAIALFQADSHLDITGEADRATIDALRKAHGA